MRICIDIDGTICVPRKLNQRYEDVAILDGAAEQIRKMKANGHYIILYTSRGMATYNNNLGQIIANNAKPLIDWLLKHQIPYDEIVFGKPLADLYIDDKARKFTTWKDIDNAI